MLDVREPDAKADSDTRTEETDRIINLTANTTLIRFSSPSIISEEKGGKNWFHNLLLDRGSSRKTATGLT